MVSRKDGEAPDLIGGPFRPGPQASRSPLQRGEPVKYDVAELVCDPHWWQSEIQQWEQRWPGRVLTFGTHVPARMVPATDAAYSAIVEGRLSHNGDKRLERHVRNCVVKQTSAGAVVAKDHKNSSRKVDLAIAMIIGIDRALFHAHQPVKRYRVGVF